MKRNNKTVIMEVLTKERRQKEIINKKTNPEILSATAEKEHVYRQTDISLFLRPMVSEKME